MTYSFAPTPQTEAMLLEFDEWLEDHPDEDHQDRHINQAVRQMILAGVIIHLGSGRIALTPDRARVAAYCKKHPEGG
jgi:hypothetical protein